VSTGFSHLLGPRDAQENYPAKYRYYDWSDTYHDDDLYFFYHKASPWKRKQLLCAAWKEEAEAKQREGV